MENYKFKDFYFFCNSISGILFVKQAPKNKNCFEILFEVGHLVVVLLSLGSVRRTKDF